MKQSDLIKELTATYKKHGWQCRRLLLSSETRASLRSELGLEVGAELGSEVGFNSPLLNGVTVEQATIDGLWFSRDSHDAREAWELRLLSENPFALFETFEKDESEEQREELRREMEARMREYVGKH